VFVLVGAQNDNVVSESQRTKKSPVYVDIPVLPCQVLKHVRKYDFSIKSTVQAQKNQNRFSMLISYVQGALGHLVFGTLLNQSTHRLNVVVCTKAASEHGLFHWLVEIELFVVWLEVYTKRTKN